MGFLSLIAWFRRVHADLTSPKPTLQPLHQHCARAAGSLDAPDLLLGSLGAFWLLLFRMSFGIHVDSGRSREFLEICEVQTNAT